MLLFHAVHTGPTYLIFPLIALSPVITIALSLLAAARAHRAGSAPSASCSRSRSLPLFDYEPGAGRQHTGRLVLLALVILAAWGVQAYFIKLANAP